MIPRYVGDIYLLFHSFPYDFEVDLPLNLLPDVYLENTPEELIESVDPALADFVLPGYHLPGMGLTHCSLRYSAKSGHNNKFDPTYLFFSSISALRLQLPCGLSIAGKFKIDESGNDMVETELFQLDSPWYPYDHSLYYNADVIRSASQIAHILIQDPALGNKRLTTAIIYFTQITCGFSISYQLSYLGLFACLEALFVPDGPYKGKTLGRRIEKFLGGYSFNFDIADWIEDEYRTVRNKYAHGVLDINPTTKIRDSRVLAFGRLHEIVRLCMLGFFSLETSVLYKLNGCSKKKLQKELDILPSASGKYILNQSPFCS